MGLESAFKKYMSSPCFLYRLAGASQTGTWGEVGQGERTVVSSPHLAFASYQESKTVWRWGISLAGPDMINSIPSASVPYRHLARSPRSWERPCFHWGSGSNPMHWSLAITGGLGADMKLGYWILCTMWHWTLSQCLPTGLFPGGWSTCEYMDLEKTVSSQKWKVLERELFTPRSTDLTPEQEALLPWVPCSKNPLSGLPLGTALSQAKVMCSLHTQVPAPSSRQHSQHLLLKQPWARFQGLHRPLLWV